MYYIISVRQIKRSEAVMITASSQHILPFEPGVDVLLGCSPNTELLRANFEDSWAETFRQTVLPALPMNKIRALYCSNNGRPTHNLVTLTGMVVLQEQFNLTDKGILEEVLVNRRFQYALNILVPNDNNVLICYNTYYNFRHKLIDNNLIDPIFKSVTSHLAEIFNVNLNKQRLDSTHYSD
jgi:hypothetical protein